MCERERGGGRVKRKSQRVNELGGWRKAEDGIVKRKRIERERVREKKKVIRKE